MKRIAIANENGLVSQHFGHCQGFSFFEIEDGVPGKEEYLASPGHRPGYLPEFLEEQGAQVVISGGMGQGAIELFAEKKIKVILGAIGEVKAVAEAYAKGDLESTGSVCTDHMHHDQCER